MASQDCLGWLRFANMDIDAAQELFSKPQNPRQRPLEIILYHCQQGAEKALKAYIVQHELLTKNLQVHDLQILRQRCALWNMRFNNQRIIGHCSYLDPFSVTIRYPQHSLVLDSGHAAKGLNSSKRLFDFVNIQLGLKSIYF